MACSRYLVACGNTIGLKSRGGWGVEAVTQVRGEYPPAVWNPEYNVVWVLKMKLSVSFYYSIWSIFPFYIISYFKVSLFQHIIIVHFNSKSVLTYICLRCLSFFLSYPLFISSHYVIILLFTLGGIFYIFISHRFSSENLLFTLCIWHTKIRSVLSINTEFW